jgi:hypothetical protein
MKLQMNLLRLMLLVLVLAPVTAYAAVSGPAPIPPPPTFQITTTTLSLCKGMINVVPITVSTPAGAQLMQDVQLSLANSKSADVVGNGTVSSVNVTANTPRVIRVPIFVSLNTSSLISTGVEINYQYDTLYSDSEVRNISFGVQSCPATLSVNVTPGVLTSGKIENVTLNLKNNGNTTLNQISIKASLPSQDGTFLGIQPVQVSAISPHAKSNVTESLFVYRNASQSFPINLNISLYNGTSLEQISDNPIALSTGIINLSASSITLSPLSPTAGSIFSISFVLTDVGTTGASALTATALTPQGFASYGSNSVFVGDIQVDTQTPVTLTLTANSLLKDGTYTIPVRLSYLNSLRQNLSTVVDVPVALTAAFSTNALGGNTTTHIRGSATRSGGGGIIILILIILVIVFVYLYWKERKKRAKTT